MILTCLLAATHADSSLELDMLVGGRTAPEAAIQLPREWENELDPTVVPALIGRWRWSDSRGLWAAVRGATWMSIPEEDANLVELGPRLGWGLDADRWAFEIAAGYDLQGFVFLPEASNGRAEAWSELSIPLGRQELALELTALHRHYPLQPSWGFGTIEPGLAWRGPLAGNLRGTLQVSAQANQGWVIDTAGEAVRATGGQLEARLELGYTGGTWELRASYRPIFAFGGLPDEGDRPQFTPMGEYTDDADALSGGGFVQHRASLDAHVVLEEWTLRARAMGRLRSSELAGSQTLARTLHGSIAAERPVRPGLTLVGEVGASGVELADGSSYLDLSGWVGVRVARVD